MSTLPFPGFHFPCAIPCVFSHPRLFLLDIAGKGGKNRRRGKGDGEESKRELEFKEDGA
jgi:hypothetical protein